MVDFWLLTSTPPVSSPVPPWSRNYSGFLISQQSVLLISPAVCLEQGWIDTYYMLTCTRYTVFVFLRALTQSCCGLLRYGIYAVVGVFQQAEEHTASICRERRWTHMFLRYVGAPLSATPESTIQRRENLRSQDIQFFFFTKYWN